MESLENDRLANATQIGRKIEDKVIKVRCPTCFKLYAVDTVEINEAKPHFECVKCQTQFWMPYPECMEQSEILGFPAEWLQREGPLAEPQAEEASGEIEDAVAEPTTQLDKKVARDQKSSDIDERKFHCPRCEAQYSMGDTECPKCGVVFAKLNFLKNEDSEIYASQGLRNMWRQVIDHYANESVHQKFVHACQRENNLVYAGHQYRRLLQAHAGDEMALAQQRVIEKLSETLVGLKEKPHRPAKGKRRRLFMPRLTIMMMLLGGVLVGLGVTMPGARNLIGLGVAVCFFVAALNLFFRRRF